MILRNFLYLDSSTVADYLSTLDGSVIEGPVDHTHSSKNEMGVKVDFKVVQGGGSGGGSSETKETRLVTDAAKFQRLYELIEEEHIQPLDGFDDAIWKQIRRGELLEIQAKITTPEFYRLTEAVGSFAPMIEVFKAVDPSLVDKKAEEAMVGLGGIAKMLEGKPVPLIFQPASTPGYHFVAELTRSFLRCEMSQLQGEATVLGKVLRILEKGQSHEAFNVLPSIPNLNRQAKRRMQADSKSKKMTETVKGPGAILAPVAVYR